MTNHSELTDSIPGNIDQQKMFAALRSISPDPTQLSGVGGGYVDNRMVQRSLPRLRLEYG
jgi:hypothetical protein